MEKAIREYNLWLSQENIDEEIRQELVDMRWDARRIGDAFGNSLNFGTSGLRGIMGAGLNRMNRYTVMKVTKGIADYLKNTYEDPSFIIAYDSRKNSRKFAVAAAEVMAANGVPTYIFKEMATVSMLSFAIRRLGVSLGVMITASHNSREYNGYKVYCHSGYQITENQAADILDFSEKVDIFKDIEITPFEEGLKWSIISYVEDGIADEFTDAIIKCRSHKVKPYNMSICYTPLYGAGLIPLEKVFSKAGIRELHLVKNQIEHDGSFETCPYPNPEKKETYNEAIKEAKECDAQVIIMTDPDGDRIGIAVKKGDDYRILSGNETAILMFNYICRTRKGIKHGICYRSLVSTPFADKIAAKYKVEMKTTLTGFKNIGESIVKKGEENKLVFAFEESNGCLIGNYSMDKDGIGACMIACDMIAYYGDPLKALDDLYKKYGYTICRSIEIVEESIGGCEKIREIMESLREDEEIFSEGKREDLLLRQDELKADIIKFETSDNVTMYIRPSGTEPKLKIYVFSEGKTHKEADEKADKICREITEYLKEKQKTV